jgi:hypothetical protein
MSYLGGVNTGILRTQRGGSPAAVNPSHCRQQQQQLSESEISTSADH